MEIKDPPPGAPVALRPARRPRTEAKPPAPVLKSHTKPTPGVDFTENMHGSVAAVPNATVVGFGANSELDFHLTITHDDIQKLASDPEHFGRAEGYVNCPALGGRLPVDKGEFRLFKQAPDKKGLQMIYDLDFKSADGTPYHLRGVKEVRDDRGWDAWRDTTTLFTTITRGSEVVGKGVLRLGIADLTEQLTTFRAPGAKGFFGKLKALGTFFKYFVSSLVDTYVKPKFKLER